MNECYIDDGTDTVQGIERINKQRFGLNCKICSSKAHGACIQCIEPKCVYAAHPSCALEKGLQMVMETDYIANTMRYYIYCDRHRTVGSQSIPRILRAPGEPVAPPHAGSIVSVSSTDTTSNTSTALNPSKPAVPPYDPFMDPTKDCCICSFGMRPQDFKDPGLLNIMQCANCKMKAHVGCYGVSDSGSLGIPCLLSFFVLNVAVSFTIYHARNRLFLYVLCNRR